jgi:hypothetical protein
MLDKEDTKPFRSYIAPYTLTRYIGYWQSYILFCYRMSELQDERLEFTRDQIQYLIVVHNILNNYTEDDAGLGVKHLDFRYLVNYISFRFMVNTRQPDRIP